MAFDLACVGTALYACLQACMLLIAVRFSEPVFKSLLFHGTERKTEPEPFWRNRWNSESALTIREQNRNAQLAKKVKLRVTERINYNPKKRMSVIAEKRNRPFDGRSGNEKSVHAPVTEDKCARNPEKLWKRLKPALSQT